MPKTFQKRHRCTPLDRVDSRSSCFALLSILFVYVFAYGEDRVKGDEARCVASMYTPLLGSRIVFMCKYIYTCLCKGQAYIMMVHTNEMRFHGDPHSSNDNRGREWHNSGHVSSLCLLSARLRSGDRHVPPAEELHPQPRGRLLLRLCGRPRDGTCVSAIFYFIIFLIYPSHFLFSL